MPLDPVFSPLAIREGPRRKGRTRRIVAAIAGVLGVSSAVVLAYGPARLGWRPRPGVVMATVHRGDVTLVVTESGVLECASDSVVRCRVEPFLSLPAATAKRPSSDEAAPKFAASAGSTAMSPTAAAAGTAANAVGKVAALASAAAAPSAGESPMPAGDAGAGSAGAAATPQVAPPRRAPTIRSFAYTVSPHVPVRVSASEPVIRAGSTPRPPTILSILPEGTRARRGEVVCELDSSTFRLEYQAQQVRHLQMQALVEQARSMLAVDEIALREYEEGILPQDRRLVRQHILTCTFARDWAAQNLEWSRMVAAKGYRSARQVQADACTLLEAEIRLGEGNGMLARLDSYTARRIIAALKAKIEAARADMLALESSFELASERLRRIGAMVDHCTMRAPRDGIVVYAKRTSIWGSSETQIREGLVVYQSQPIFRMLDPKDMVVKARINESQVARLRPGLPALVRFDAFPDRPVHGTVGAITAIPALAGGPASDVRSYVADVQFESGQLEGLHNGLSAEVDFLVETRRSVPRLPLGAIRWAGGRSFAAVVSGGAASRPTWKWQPIVLGPSDTRFAEVRSGLEPGTRVIANPEDLPAPRYRPRSTAG
jgi:multidrug resistance efflux pump